MQQDISYYRNRSDSLRVSLNSNELTKPRSLKRIILVDDDPSFSRILQRAAKIKGIELDICQSIEELSNFALNEFDILIADYMLEANTGLDIAALVAENNLDIPVILISQTANIPKPKEWPDNIREFVHKKLGPYAILEAVIEAYEINSIFSTTLKYPKI